jgi:protein ImuB
MAGFTRTWVGVGDVAVVSDAAASLAEEMEGSEGKITGFSGVATGDGSIIVAPHAGATFLAPLPLSFLPIPDELRETLRALGFRRIGDLAIRERNELETRFGPSGVQAHRWARAEDDRTFRSLDTADLPEVSLELEGPVATLEPLLFVLRHLLHRACADLLEMGRCATRLSLELHLDRRVAARRARVLPARPTRREDLLYDLCRASLERAVGNDGCLKAPVHEVVLRVEETAPPGARQGDLFAGDWRDPMAAAAALSRLRARLGENAVAWPQPRAIHRPESRSRWRRVAAVETPEEDKSRTSPSPGACRLVSGEGVCDSVLHLLPEPVQVIVRAEEGHPVELRDAGGCHPLIVAEGPERISGDWWNDPYRREYYRACTGEGELLWLFREWQVKGGEGDRREAKWWLHGFYD